jgi:hypothetical protein
MSHVTNSRTTEDHVFMSSPGWPCVSHFWKQFKQIPQSFDEEYEDEDGVKGGDLKKGFLLGRDIPRVVKFDSRPHLDALIDELTETFAVRYEKPPSTDQINKLRRLRAKGLTDDDLGNDSVLNHTKRVASLKSPDWLVDTFRRHLNAGSWPPSDKAQGQPIGSGSSKKRVRE